VKPADDDVVRNSVSVVDDSIRVDTPYGPAWYRYVGDAYGELARSDPGGPWAGTGDGRGRLWPIFTGERGEYELRARADGPDAFGGTDEDALEPDALWRRWPGSATPDGCSPSRCGTVSIRPTTAGSSAREPGATPLAWSMAGFIRLAHGVEAGEPVETPTVVRDRYVERDRSATPDLDATAEYVNNHLVVAGERPPPTRSRCTRRTNLRSRRSRTGSTSSASTRRSRCEGRRRRREHRRGGGADDTAAAGDESTDTDAILDEFSGAGTAVKRLRV